MILGSGSPRRKELLGLIVDDFTVQIPNCEEVVASSDPREVTEDLSRQKAEAVARAGEDISNAVIIGSDTVVSIEGEILGKPENREEARTMIQKLSGRCHLVSTGVTLICTAEDGTVQKVKTFSETTKVYVAGMSETEIEDYIGTKEPYDKAGAYGIQGIFAKYIEKIEGDYNAVVGLPVHRLYEELEKLWGKMKK